MVSAGIWWGRRAPERVPAPVPSRGVAPATNGQPPAQVFVNPLPPTPVIGTAVPLNPNLPPQTLPVRPLPRATSALSVGAPPKATVAPRAVAITVQIFNDANANGTGDAGEGMSSISVLAYDAVSNVPLAWTFTDAEGRVKLGVTTDNPVIVRVPLLDYSNQVTGMSAALQIALTGPSSDTTIPATLP